MVTQSTTGPQTSNFEIDLKTTSETVDEVTIDFFMNIANDISGSVRVKHLGGDIYSFTSTVEQVGSAETVTAYGFDVTTVNGFSIGGALVGVNFQWNAGRVYILFNYSATTFNAFYAITKK